MWAIAAGIGALGLHLDPTTFLVVVAVSVLCVVMIASVGSAPRDLPSAPTTPFPTGGGARALSSKLAGESAAEGAVRDADGKAVASDSVTDATNGVPFPELELRPLPRRDATIEEFGDGQHRRRRELARIVASEIANYGTRSSELHADSDKPATE